MRPFGSSVGELGGQLPSSVEMRGKKGRKSELQAFLCLVFFNEKVKQLVYSLQHICGG
jgi:hypothetical protein